MYAFLRAKGLEEAFRMLSCKTKRPLRPNFPLPIGLRHSAKEHEAVREIARGVKWKRKKVKNRNNPGGATLSSGAFV